MPTFVIQQSHRERVAELRAGLGDEERVVVLGIDARTFSETPGIDALYMSITRAERWGARPGAPHEATLLETGQRGMAEGLPPYVIAGLVLKEEEPNTAEFCVPLIVGAILRVVAERNRLHRGAIRTVGFMEFELTFPGAAPADVGRALAASLR